MGNVIEFIKYHLRMTKFSLPSSIRIIDIVQILLIAIFVYYLMVWIKNTRAYTLLKGVLIVSVFLIIAAILRMDTNFMDLSTAECSCDHRRAGHFPAGASPCTGAAGSKKRCCQI